MRKTQQSKILDYLRTHRKGLTNAKAFWLFWATRLGGQIYELRQKGFEICTIREDNVLSRGTHARYVLLKEPDRKV